MATMDHYDKTSITPVSTTVTSEQADQIAKADKYKITQLQSRFFNVKTGAEIFYNQ